MAAPAAGRSTLRFRCVHWPLDVRFVLLLSTQTQRYKYRQEVCSKSSFRTATVLPYLVVPTGRGAPVPMSATVNVPLLFHGLPVPEGKEHAGK